MQGAGDGCIQLDYLHCLGMLVRNGAAAPDGSKKRPRTENDGLGGPVLPTLQTATHQAATQRLAAPGGWCPDSKRQAMVH